MCDDCTDHAWSEVYARDDQIERLERELANMTQLRDYWFEENRQAEMALDKMHRLAVDAPFEHENVWAVPAQDIEDVYAAWLHDEDGEDS
jgi:hypothetical protein